MTKAKAHELRTKSKRDLLGELEKFRAELAQLRVAQKTGGAASKLAKIKVVRKNIARVLTVYNQTQKAKLREHLKGKKFLPTDLRFKKTRAQRLALSRTDAARKTEAQKKKLNYFPVRRFAVKAE